MDKAESPFRFGGPGTSPLVVAHRGSSVRNPENTASAFAAAVSEGADLVEFDVRLTRDGVPVVLHDALVDRTTDGTGAVRGLSLDEVRHLRCSGPGAHTIPTLREALEQLDGVGVGVDIEMKLLPGEPDHESGGGPLPAAVAAELEATGFGGPVLVSSFDLAALDRLAEVAPTVPRGLLVVPAWPVGEALGAAARAGARALLPQAQRLTDAGAAEFLERAHRRGLAMGVWVVDEPEEALGFAALGVDAIATNDPEPIVSSLRERGA